MEIEIGLEKKKKDGKGKYGQPLSKYQDYEIESCAEKIVDVEKLKKDKEKMVYVAKALKAKSEDSESAISSISDLRAARDKAVEEEEYEDEEA